jgi:peptidoglycan/xylan/chitin deacetylase (PgdA/CDA1 family)
MPPTFGFVNGLRVEEHSSDLEVLRAWRAAGHELGSHTWSHINLNQHSVEEFENDLVRNESLLSKFMGDDRWRWLRFPYLAAGDTAEKRAAVRGFLNARGYKIAAVTMSFADYLWNEPYARCSAVRDVKSISVLRAAYLAAAEQNIDYYRGLSHQLVGRDINYVLLLHIGAFDAEMMPELLRLYQSKGFEFVTLPQAQADAFYASDNDPGLPAGAETLEQAMAERHMEAPKHPAVPLEFDRLCR